MKQSRVLAETEMLVFTAGPQCIALRILNQLPKYLGSFGISLGNS